MHNKKEGHCKSLQNLLLQKLLQITMTFDMAVITYVLRIIIIVVILIHLLPEVICVLW